MLLQKRKWKLLGGLALGYAAVYILCLILGGIFAAESACTMEDKTCNFGNAFFLMLATFHGTTWGVLRGSTAVQNLMCCIIASVGFLWPPLTFLLFVRMSGMKDLAKRGLIVFAICYISFALIANLILSGIMLDTCVYVCSAVRAHEFHGPLHGSASPYGFAVYSLWMAFHERSYGDVGPDPFLTNEKVVFVLMECFEAATWIVPAFAMAWSAVRKRTLLEDEAGPRLLRKVMMAVLMPLCICYCLIFILSGFFLLAQPEQCRLHIQDVCDYGDAFFLLMSTFHGNSYGTFVPQNSGQAVIACIVASLGFLWKHICIIACLSVAGVPDVAKLVAKTLFVSYVLLGFVSTLVISGILVAADDTNNAQNGLCAQTLTRWHREGTTGSSTCHFNVTFYYSWLSFHGRAYGDIHYDPTSTLESALSCLLVVLGSVCTASPAIAVCWAAPPSAVLQNVEESNRAPGVDLNEVIGATEAVPDSKLTSE